MKKVLAFGLASTVLACANPAKDKPAAVVTASRPAAATAQEGGKETTWSLLPERSRIEWTGSKVTGKHDGGFQTFSGSVRSPDGTLEKATVSLEINVDSLYSDDERLTGHLKSPDFFDVAKFPKATFASTAIRPDPSAGTHLVEGNLTLHGVTKGIAFPAKLALEGGAIRGSAEFPINRKDFGIVYPGKPDDLIRDEVVIRLTLDAPTATP